MVLEPSALIFALHDGGEVTFGSYRGEIRCDIDSEDTAFITMTEDVQRLLIEKLRPLGVRYMRWWVDGRLVGRTFEDAL